MQMEALGLFVWSLDFFVMKQCQNLDFFVMKQFQNTERAK
jgi:hypothetical protein